MFKNMSVASLKNYNRRLLPSRTSVQCKSILYIGITLAILCAQSTVANPEVRSSNQTNIGVANTTHEDVEIESSQEDDYYAEEEYNNNSTSWRDGNWRRQDNSKIAQVVVYCSVIVIALAGVLIKYFVTQYETSQMKAQEQLNYHRLQTA